MFKRYITILILGLGIVTNLFSQEKPYYFYHGRDYGSESIVDPVRLILNGGYGIMQADNRPNYPMDVHYKKGWNNVMDNLKSPLDAIKAEGWGDFISTEILPTSINSGKAYYWPNYTQHVIGGGMTYRMMQEWYRFHNYKYPKIYAASTLTLYHLLNEVVENDDYKGYNIDPISDIYLFNPLGMLLFSSDRVAGFFSNTLNMADWSYQIAFNPENESVINNGQNFVIKYKMTPKLGLFYYWGNHGELGLSFYRSNGECLSVGAGLTSRFLQELEADVRALKADLVLSSGIFYDRNNSLLASLVYSKTQDYKYRLNVYPGVLHIGSVSPGFFVCINHENDINLGLNFRILPFGFGTRFY